MGEERQETPAGATRDAERAALFARHRAYLFAVAYRLLGVAEDAEDVLQEAWLRVAASRGEEPRDPRAYLVTVVTRLCVDLLRSTRRQREEYVGVWLPQPLPTEEVLPDELLEEAESVSFAFLLLLERLTPLQRAVLVLHDVLEWSHAEIGRALERRPDATRQILRRARESLGDRRPPKGLPRERADDLVALFQRGASSGDLEPLLAALAPDVVLMSDGGGRVNAARRPLAGREGVGRFLHRVGRQAAWSPVRAVELNGQPALLTFEEGRLTNALVFDSSAAGLTAVYVVRNPDKLGRILTAAS